MKVSSKPTCPTKLKKLLYNFKKEVRAKYKKHANSVEHWTDIVHLMPKKWGLVIKAHGGMSDVFFVSKKHGFVVKRPWCVGGVSEKPRCAIFTLQVPFRLKADIEQDEEMNSPLFLQPFADTRKKYEALEAVEASRYARCSRDLHEGNVAVYDGKVVLIDW